MQKMFNDILNDKQLSCMFRISPEFTESNKLSCKSSVSHAINSYIKRKDLKVSRDTLNKVADEISEFLGVHS